MGDSPWAISHPFGAPTASKMPAHFVERWFFPDEPAGQIKKPPYGWQIVFGWKIVRWIDEKQPIGCFSPFGRLWRPKCLRILSNGGSFQTNPPDK